MAITSLDDIIAGVKTPQFFAKTTVANTSTGRQHSFWGVGGIPGAGSYDTSLVGVALSSSTSLINGQIPYYNATATKQMHLARAVGMSSTSGIIFICDRLWHNGGMTITSNTLQTVNSAPWPARDNNGSINGEGVLIGVEISTVTGAGTPTITLGYTNSDNTSGRTATNQLPTFSTAPVGAFFPIGLQAGDKGVKSIQSITLSATWTTGVMNLVAYRVLAVLEQPNSNIGSSVDALTGGLPKLYDGTVPFILSISGGSSSYRVYGQLIYAEG